MAKRGLTFAPHPNGQYAGRNGPVTVGTSLGDRSLAQLDSARSGSANNTSKDKPNPKKFFVGMK